MVRVVGQVEEAAREGVAAHGVATDHEEGVIPGDGAEDVPQVGLVEGAGEELRRARWGAEHDEVGAGLGADEELGAQAGQAVAPGRALAGRDDRPVAALTRDGVDQCSVGAADLDGVELDEVAAQGGLGDPDPVVAEQVGELGLRTHRVGGDELDDALVARTLGERADGTHPERSRSHARTAFWAWRRFSASSHTTDCGPSMTPSEISLPR